jgi:hypothetical protein
MDIETEAQVEYIILSGSTDTDENIVSVCNIIRHSLRTQFPCKKVTITIEENIPDPDFPNPENGMCYH